MKEIWTLVKESAWKLVEPSISPLSLQVDKIFWQILPISGDRKLRTGLKEFLFRIGLSLLCHCRSDIVGRSEIDRGTLQHPRNDLALFRRERVPEYKIASALLAITAIPPKIEAVRSYEHFWSTTCSHHQQCAGGRFTEIIKLHQ